MEFGKRREEKLDLPRELRLCLYHHRAVYVPDYLERQQPGVDSVRSPIRKLAIQVMGTSMLLRLESSEGPRRIWIH